VSLVARISLLATAQRAAICLLLAAGTADAVAAPASVSVIQVSLAPIAAFWCRQAVHTTVSFANKPASQTTASKNATCSTHALVMGDAEEVRGNVPATWTGAALLATYRHMTPVKTVSPVGRKILHVAVESSATCS